LNQHPQLLMVKPHCSSCTALARKEMCSPSWALGQCDLFRDASLERDSDCAMTQQNFVMPVDE
jgi:hypothetical protein